MKIRNTRQVQMMRDAIARCGGYVALVDSSNGRTYDLKNGEILEEALARLALDYKESLELFVTRREDIEIMMELMHRFAHGNINDTKNTDFEEKRTA